MGDKKKAKKAYMAFAPLMGWPTDKDEWKEQLKDFKENLETYYKQMREVQDTVIEARKETWNKVFPKLMEMQDNFASSLPEKMPSIPGMPDSSMTPEDFMDKVKKYQEMANQHAMEQADSMVDFYKERQEKVKEAVADTVDTIVEKLD